LGLAFVVVISTATVITATTVITLKGPRIKDHQKRIP
jgi:hypothetical protein